MGRNLLVDQLVGWDGPTKRCCKVCDTYRSDTLRGVLKHIAREHPIHAEETVGPFVVRTIRTLPLGKSPKSLYLLKAVYFNDEEIEAGLFVDEWVEGATWAIAHADELAGVRA